MGFFKKVKQKINGMWYPQSITVGKPVTTDEVAKRLAIESTVSPADTFAVLKSLGRVATWQTAAPSNSTAWAHSTTQPLLRAMEWTPPTK